MIRRLLLALTVLIFAPLLGLVLNKLIFARLSTAPVYVRVVGTIGVLIALPNFALWFVGAFLNDTLGLNVADLTKEFTVTSPLRGWSPANQSSPTCSAN